MILFKIFARLRVIARTQFYALERIYEMSAALDRLTAEVSESRAATQSVLTLVSGLADQIRANVDDSDALNALADDLDAQQGEIASAVTANTPADTSGGDTGAGADSGAGSTGGDIGAGGDDTLPVDDTSDSDEA